MRGALQSTMGRELGRVVPHTLDDRVSMLLCAILPNKCMWLADA